MGTPSHLQIVKLHVSINPCMPSLQEYCMVVAHHPYTIHMQVTKCVIILVHISIMLVWVGSGAGMASLLQGHINNVMEDWDSVHLHIPVFVAKGLCSMLMARQASPPLVT